MTARDIAVMVRVMRSCRSDYDDYGEHLDEEDYVFLSSPSSLCV